MSSKEERLAFRDELYKRFIEERGMSVEQADKAVEWVDGLIVKALKRISSEWGFLMSDDVLRMGAIGGCCGYVPYCTS